MSPSYADRFSKPTNGTATPRRIVWERISSAIENAPYGFDSAEWRKKLYIHVLPLGQLRERHDFDSDVIEPFAKPLQLNDRASNMDGIKKSVSAYPAPLWAQFFRHGGKVDRATLPPPSRDAFAERAHEPPRGESERGLAEIWGDILSLDEIGRHDSFFELGGHSLSATTMLLRISDRFDVEMPLTVVFEAPTLAALAERLVAARLAQFDPDELAKLTRPHAVPS